MKIRLYSQLFTLLGLFICFVIVVNAYQTHTAEAPALTSAPIATTIIPLTTMPTDTSAITATFILSETAIATTAFDITLPTFFYIKNTNLFVRQKLDGPPLHQIALSKVDMGTILDAMQIDNHHFLILYEQGLVRFGLDNSEEIIAQFDTSTISGELVTTTKGILYSITVSDSSAPFSRSTQVGLYIPNDNSIQTILYSKQNLHILGLTADQHNMYLLPWGQDPSFGHIQVVDMDNEGVLVDELSVGGNVFATLSPNSLYISTTDHRFVSIDDPLENVLNLYELASETPKLNVIELPKSPSHAWSPIWAPDSQSLYFLIRSKDIYDNYQILYGLFRLDVNSKKPLLVTKIGPTALKIVSITRNGEWLLLKSTEQSLIATIAKFVHLSSGVTKSYSLSTGITIIKWFE